MADKYANFSQLSRHEVAGRDYRIRVRHGRSGIAILAPHGGRIERGTTPIADAIAGQEHTFYSFEGLKPELAQNRGLHITSDRFDEPRALFAVTRAHRVITIHGAKGLEPAVYLGGLDTALRRRVLTLLSEAGFVAADDPSPTRQGRGATNICNRGRTGKGLQIELTLGLRKRLFLQPEEGSSWHPSPLFFRLVSAVRGALSTYTLRGAAPNAGGTELESPNTPKAGGNW
ncbi:MAG: poly-gamma-glutamate hydrolase family protein [Gammaproteobacteria bacterium]